MRPVENSLAWFVVIFIRRHIGVPAASGPELLNLYGGFLQGDGGATLFEGGH
jgi:hypothetical protein